MQSLSNVYRAPTMYQAGPDSAAQDELTSLLGESEDKLTRKQDNNKER